MKQTIRTMSALLTIIALAVFVCSFTACTDDENDNNDITPILRPIAEHITGIWKMDKSYALENGEWVEDPIPEGYVEDIILRSDGTYILSIQNNNGGFDSMTKSYATMNKRTWSIDEVTNVLTLGELKRPVERLNDNELVFLADRATDHETGETLEGKFKWTYTRIDQLRETGYTQVLGKWRFLKRYQEKDGQWVEVAQNMPDECRREYDEASCCTLYSRTDDKEETKQYTYCTCFNVILPEDGLMDMMTMIEDERAIFEGIELEDKNTLHILRNDNFDISLEAIKLKKGGHKDVFVREE